MVSKIITKNRRAYFDYDLDEEFVAGLQLFGHEAKSIRGGNISLKGAYVTLKDNEAWLTNAHVKQYPYANNVEDYDPERPRKLLLQKKELSILQKARDQKQTIVPLSVFKAGPFLKVKIATAHGKKKHDKRSTIRARDIAIDMQRDIKQTPKK